MSSISVIIASLSNVRHKQPAVLEDLGNERGQTGSSLRLIGGAGPDRCGLAVQDRYSMYSNSI